MESNGESRATTITNTEPGIYRINVSAFGKTITGREFRLVVPEFTFNVEAVNNMMAIDGVAANSYEMGAITATTDDLLV